MAYKEKATMLHESGHNCCQAVLGCCCDKFDMSDELAYRVAAFFGGGMRRGEVCGAVSGTLMALGLKYGDENNRKSMKSLEFMKAFREEYGSVICKELLGKDDKNKKQMCPVMIEYCADYLEKEFEDE